MPDRRPNVVFMLADNLGYGDVGCFGSAGEQRGMPTPNIDRLADGGLRLNQFLVEAACTPSRAALLTGRYSIRTGLSLITVPGGHELGPDEFTLGDLFKRAGYRTSYYGKWHLGASTETEPQYHGFDEWRFGFYGSSDGTLYGDNISRTHGPAAAARAQHDPGPRGRRTAHAVEELHPYDLAYRRRIDNEMTDRRGRLHHAQRRVRDAVLLVHGDHPPALPEPAVRRVRRRVADRQLRRLHHGARPQRRPGPRRGRRRRDRARTRSWCSSPTTVRRRPARSPTRCTWPPRGRGAASSATLGRARSAPSGCCAGPGTSPRACLSRWSRSWTCCRPSPRCSDADLPDDRPIDGVDQSPHLFDGQQQSDRDHLLTFIGGAPRRGPLEPVADLHRQLPPLLDNPSLGGYLGHSNPTAGYPMAFNIEADPREQRNSMAENGWVIDPFFEAVGAYRASLKDHPNPPAANLTNF